MDFWQRERMRIREWLRGSKRPRHKGMVETMLAQRATAIRAAADRDPSAALPGGRTAQGPRRGAQPVRVVINPGHAPGAGGAPGAHINEADATGWIGDLMPQQSDDRVTYEVLRQEGTHLDRLSRGLQTHPPSILASIHLNAGLVDSRTVEVIYRGDDPDPVRREHSRRLAESVGAALARLPAYDTYTVIGIPDPRVQYSSLAVLNNTATDAAIVVEAGYITNPDTEAFVQTQEGQQGVAGALHSGIRGYLDNPQPAPAPGHDAPADRGTARAPARRGR